MLTCNDCIHSIICDRDIRDTGCTCSAFLEERPHGECNQCRHYEGVHGVQGHAPCSFWGIGGVLWNDYCSRFEKEGETETWSSFHGQLEVPKGTFDKIWNDEEGEDK